MHTKQYYNYTVVNFEPVIGKTNLEVVSYYFDNGLTLRKVNRDFKKIFTHFFVKNICTTCLNVKGVSEKILFVNPKLVSPKSEIFDYVDYDEYTIFVQRILKELDGLIPMAIYHSVDLSFDDVKYMETNDLKYNFDLIHSHSHGRKSIRKLTEYAEALGLNFLHKDYLNQPTLHRIFI